MPGSPVPVEVAQALPTRLELVRDVDAARRCGQWRRYSKLEFAELEQAAAAMGFGFENLAQDKALAFSLTAGCWARVFPNNMTNEGWLSKQLPQKEAFGAGTWQFELVPSASASASSD